MPTALLRQVRRKLDRDEPVTPEEALDLFSLEDPDVYDFFAITNRVRYRHKGRQIALCSIVNAKSNLCGEDCGFCSQASNSTAEVVTYPLLNKETILQYAAKAEADGANEFSIVTSGKGVRNDNELTIIKETLRTLRDKSNMTRCASLGVLTREALLELKAAGLQHLHHNLETSRGFYNHICTTRTFESNVETVRIAKELGIEVCCGGIMGMGESREDRVDLAMTLRELDVNPVPVNFLNPMKGTALEDARHLTPMECLKCIAVFRAILPTKDIFAMGGREVNLRDLQSMMFFAGANGTLLGNYLTTTGRTPEDDIRMIHDLGYQEVSSHSQKTTNAAQPAVAD